MRVVRLVTFDALYTLLRPRAPVHVQYADAFAAHGLGALDPDAVKRAFKIALNHLQTAHPAYAHGHRAWWRAVIERTALGAGADGRALTRALPSLVPALLTRFSSSEGYALYEDVLPTLTALRAQPLPTALVSNTDERIVSALESLHALPLLSHILISAAEGVEKPDAGIFLRACAQAGVRPEEALHVGDEVECDYMGAKRAGMQALLLRRPGEDNGRDDPEPDPEDVVKVEGLREVLAYVRRVNGPVD